jgi:flotillin
VVVMGGGAGGGNVSNFIQDLVKNTLPLHEAGKSVGLDLPAILGTYKDDAAPAKPDAPAAPKTKS